MCVCACASGWLVGMGKYVFYLLGLDSSSGTEPPLLGSYLRSLQGAGCALGAWCLGAQGLRG